MGDGNAGGWADPGAGLDHADFSEPGGGIGNGADHFSHVKGRYCQRCDREITGSQPARRKGADGWVHDTCPPDWD
jgi:hypothetical protein